MTRFVQVKAIDPRISKMCVNPDTVALTEVVDGILTLTLVNGDIVGVQDDSGELVDRLRGNQP